MGNQNMNKILNDLSAPSLIAAIEANLFAFVPAFSKWPGAEVHDEPEIAWSMTDIPFQVFNSIIRAQLAPDRIDAVIAAIIAQATSRNVPLLWWTGPATQPADLGIHLERHGFFSEGQLPGMAAVLDNINPHPPMPNGFMIQPVTDDESLQQWSQVCAAGFGMPAFAADGYYDLLRHVDQATVRAYLGWLNGKPVATSLLYLGAGVAGIYNVATIPEARRKGIGARMTDLPLLEARALGYQVGILHAFEMGIGVYRSLGFEEYCQIGQYLWLPEQM